MAEFFTFDNVLTLVMLISLQAVLGIDNLLYISFESKKAPPESVARARKIGIMLAIVLRVGLLFLLVSLIDLFQDELFGINIGDVLHSSFSGHSIIVLLGGIFIIYTAVKEIWHLISHENIADYKIKGGQQSTAKTIFMICLMNIVFSFDSVLGGLALTSSMDNYALEMTLQSIAVVISGLIMIFMADGVAKFLQKNRMFEVLGLFVLFIVGIMLLTEGGHLAHIKIFGNEIVPMSKTTFYFVLVVLIVVDVIQTRYQKKIIKLEQLEAERRKNQEGTPDDTSQNKSS